MDQDQERWAECPVRPTYQVSTLGRIMGPTGVIRQPKRCDDGYQRIVLGPRPRITKTIHSLVAEAFLGPRPLHFVVAHKNGDRADNRLDNLQYTTHRGNFMHRRAAGTGVCPLLAIENGHQRVVRQLRHKAKGEAHGMASTLNESIVAQIHAIYLDVPNCAEVDRRLGLPYGTSCHVVAGRRWRHLHPDAMMRK